MTMAPSGGPGVIDVVLVAWFAMTALAGMTSVLVASTAMGQSRSDAA